MTRKFDLLLSDMDGTLTEVRSPWEYVHRRLGIWDGNGDRHLKAWLAGEIDYAEFFKRDVDMWLGMEKSQFLGMLDEIGFKPGVTETMCALAGAGVEVVILSTGFSYVAERISAACAAPVRHFANVLRFDASERFTGMDMILSGDEKDANSKSAAAARLIREKGVDPGRCAALGDSAGDLGMFRVAGTAIAVHGSPDLGEHARLPGPDLRTLLPLML